MNDFKDNESVDNISTDKGSDNNTNSVMFND